MKRIAFHLIFTAILITGCNSKTSKSIENLKPEFEKKEIPTRPKRVNQKFFASLGDRDTLTVKSFYGGTGIEYPTYEEAVWNNEIDEMILIKNVEHGSVSKWKESFLFESQTVIEPFSPLHENYQLNQSLLKSVWRNLVNKNYHEVIEKGTSENLIEIKELEKIGKLVDSKPKVS